MSNLINKSNTVKKAVIAAAGFGTRFLPATKASPKEMLPVVDKPIIQYVVEEVVKAGITDICIVTGWHKRSIEDHFDYPFELEKRLDEWGKFEEVKKVREIADMANFHYIRQKGPFGNGTPILNAKSFIGDDPFIYLWADEFFITDGENRCEQLIRAFQEKPASAILGSLRKSSDIDYKLWGYAVGEEVVPGELQVKHTVEKPGPGVVNSDYAIFSPYLFTAEMVSAIEEAVGSFARNAEKRELYVVEGINVLLEKGLPVRAVEMKGGRYYNCGDKLGFLEATVEMGLRHPELAESFKKYLKQITQEM